MGVDGSSKPANKKRETNKFLENFDPDKSSREKRKLNRKLYNVGRKPKMVYDSDGHLDGQDNCDCLTLNCPGCHFPCPKCSSTKCATECRVNRRWGYDRVDVEGTAP